MPIIGGVAPAGSGLPAGGAAGQALLKTGGTDYAYGWADSGAGQPCEPIYQSGKWYDNRVMGGTTITTISTAANRSTATFMPVWLSVPITVDAVGGAHYLSGGTVGPVAQAFYTSRTDTGLPGTLLGSISFTPGAASGAFTSGTGTPVALPAGWVWMGLFPGASADYYLCGTGVGVLRFPMISQGQSGPWSLNYSSQTACFRAAAAPATPPTVAPANIAAVYGGGGSGNAPVFCFRVA